MTDLHDRLPRLSALVMFEAAARHMSFTVAGRELGVTQAAVSQQVRAIERELGVVLFRRLHRGLELTREGDRLHRSVSMALEHIANTTEEIRQVNRTPAIAIGVTFAVATFWLVPRLPRFRALHPEIDVHVVASDRGFDRVADQVDAGIAFGDGRWPGFTSQLLRRGEVFPVCSPNYLRGRHLARAEDLANETLLSLDDDRPGLMDWPIWLAEQGVKGYAAHRNLKFNSHPLLLQAACEGQGIALGWSLLVDDLLARGTLIRPLAATLRTPKGFYFVLREGQSSSEVTAFREWIWTHFDDADPQSVTTRDDRSPVSRPNT